MERLPGVSLTRKAGADAGSGYTVESGFIFFIGFVSNVCEGLFPSARLYDWTGRGLEWPDGLGRACQKRGNTHCT